MSLVNNHRCIAILGPTGSGKSAVAVTLARRLKAPIISCDSMQVYKGMDVGTAKPSADIRREIRHHMIDICDIHERWDVNRFVSTSRTLLEAYRAENRPIILAGGTGLYARALIYDYDLMPADRETAAQVEAEYCDRNGHQKLIVELETYSPRLASQLAANPRHLKRAVEVARLTGTTPHTSDVGRTARRRPLPEFYQFVLMPDTDVHREWIRVRTQKMFEEGWIDETRSLLHRGLKNTPTAYQALGYGEICDYLSGNGALNESELLSRVISRTNKYARRQRTWFRHQHPGSVGIRIDETFRAKSVADDIYTQVINNLPEHST